MMVPENSQRVKMRYSLVSVNCQGINREKETPTRKWDEVTTVVVETQADVLACQEMWGSQKKERQRTIAGYWMQQSQHTKVGQANELWVRLAWARKQESCWIYPVHSWYWYAMPWVWE